MLSVLVFSFPAATSPVQQIIRVAMAATGLLPRTLLATAPTPSASIVPASVLRAAATSTTDSPYTVLPSSSEFLPAPIHSYRNKCVAKICQNIFRPVTSSVILIILRIYGSTLPISQLVPLPHWQITPVKRRR